MTEKYIDTQLSRHDDEISRLNQMLIQVVTSLKVLTEKHIALLDKLNSYIVKEEDRAKRVEAYDKRIALLEQAINDDKSFKSRLLRLWPAFSLILLITFYLGHITDHEKAISLITGIFGR